MFRWILSAKHVVPAPLSRIVVDCTLPVYPAHILFSIMLSTYSTWALTIVGTVLVYP